MEQKIQALGRYFAAILTQDFLAYIPRDRFHYIRPRTAQRLLQLLYLTILQAAAMLISLTKAAPAAVYLEIYYLTALVLAAVAWRRSGYSLVSYTIIHLLCNALLWAAILR